MPSQGLLAPIQGLLGSSLTQPEPFQVCAAPEDATKQESVSPLKAEVVAGSRPKKRGKDSKRQLTDDEKTKLASTARLFLSCAHGAETKMGLVAAFGPSEGEQSHLIAVKSARELVDSMGKELKFTVIYSNFPQVMAIFRFLRPFRPFLGHVLPFLDLVPP